MANQTVVFVAQVKAKNSEKRILLERGFGNANTSVYQHRG